MKLIIGGAYQGKLDYAKKNFGPEGCWADGRTCAPEAIRTCRGIYYFHIYLRRLLQSNRLFPITESGRGQFTVPDVSGGGFVDDLSELERQAEAFAEELCRCNPEIIIVTNELGCGIVPIEKTDRLWREATGRICTSLASRADEVVRVVCGIGVKLKQESARK